MYAFGHYFILVFYNRCINNALRIVKKIIASQKYTYCSIAIYRELQNWIYKFNDQLKLFLKFKRRYYYSS